MGPHRPNHQIVGRSGRCPGFGALGAELLHAGPDHGEIIGGAGSGHVSSIRYRPNLALLAARIQPDFGKFYGSLTGDLKCYRRACVMRRGRVTRSSPEWTETGLQGGGPAPAVNAAKGVES